MSEYKTPTISEAPFLTIVQAAEMLHVSEVTIRRHIREGLLPAWKYGNRVLIRVEDIESLVTRRVPTGGDVA